jgi:dicarboxylate transporter 10
MAPAKEQKQPFWLGGAAASMAACFTHPLDQTKYRMQVQASRTNILRALYGYASRDGVRALWAGLSASILRQSTYSTTRFGLYNYLVQETRRMSGKDTLTTPYVILCSGLAGGIAGMVGNPTEVVLVRMCADGAKPLANRFMYTNALNALHRIFREEGMKTFSRGLGPNIMRSVLMNVSQIATYSSAKSYLQNTMKFRDGTPLHICASLMAGTVATTVCAPADVLKSRLQSTTASGPDKQTITQVIRNSLKTEGPRFLMRGWTPAWLRLTPNTILMFIFIEQLQGLVNSFMLIPPRLPDTLHALQVGSLHADLDPGKEI